MAPKHELNGFVMVTKHAVYLSIDIVMKPVLSAVSWLNNDKAFVRENKQGK